MAWTRAAAVAEVKERGGWTRCRGRGECALYWVDPTPSMRPTMYAPTPLPPCRKVPGLRLHRNAQTHQRCSWEDRGSRGAPVLYGGDNLALSIKATTCCDRYLNTHPTKSE